MKGFAEILILVGLLGIVALFFSGSGQLISDKGTSIKTGDRVTIEFWCGTPYDMIQECKEGDTIVFNEINPSNSQITQRLRDIETLQDTFMLQRTQVGNVARLHTSFITSGTSTIETGVICGLCPIGQPTIQTGERLTIAVSDARVVTPMPTPQQVIISPRQPDPIIVQPQPTPLPQKYVCSNGQVVSLSTDCPIQKPSRIPLLSDLIDFIISLFGGKK